MKAKLKSGTCIETTTKHQIIKIMDLAMTYGVAVDDNILLDSAKDEVVSFDGDIITTKGNKEWLGLGDHFIKWVSFEDFCDMIKNTPMSIKAEEARLLMKSDIGSIMSPIYELIRNAAISGRSNTHIHERPLPIVIQILESNGFKYKELDALKFYKAEISW